MRASPIVFSALLLAACQPAPTQPVDTFAGGESATVVRIFDGDSLLVDVNGEEVEIRLLGLNAPEGSECHGDAARGALQSLLEGRTLRLVGDADEADQFDRALRYLYAGNTDVNLELIRRGHANVVQGDHSRNDEFSGAADDAAAAEVGMWAPSACGAETPPVEVIIADFEYNPPGRDADNPNGERVVIANTGSQPIELGGWLLRDESTRHRYRFPDGFSLGPGAEVAVRSGCGSNSGEELYWCAGDAVWSNGGDSVILQLSDGTVVARTRYSGDY